MKIGPIDIRNHVFTKRMRGVDEHEVHDYLDLVADRLEEVILEAEELRGQIDRLEGEVRDHRALERSLRDSMLSAERLVDDRTAQAEKEAQIVVKNAEVQAGKILLQAREELGRLRAEIDDLRRQKVTYVERFRALLRSQGKILEASLESFDPDADPERRPEPRRAEPASPSPGAAVSYVTQSPVHPAPVPPAPVPPAPVPSAPASAEPARREPTAPVPFREPPPSADPLARASTPWEPADASRENFAPYGGQEGLFGGENA